MTFLEAIESIYKRFMELGIIGEEKSDIKDALEHCHFLLTEEQKLEAAKGTLPENQIKENKYLTLLLAYDIIII